MRKIIAGLIFFTSVFSAKVTDKEIANMFILGFYGTAGNDLEIKKDICQKGLGGVILFGRSPVKAGAVKNFKSAGDLKALISDLKSCNSRVLVAIDQEGGAVQRVKFKKYPKASTVAKYGINTAYKTYLQMARELKNLGFNLNFAPVADLAKNSQNRVIVKWGRSYGKDAKTVASYDKAFIKAMHSYGILTSLKHFPGHGSSFGDTHKGFVDVTNYWGEDELVPYKLLKNITDTVMVAHIFNRRYDANYPASLSRNIVTGLLRNKIGFRGVVITDDMQMGAIAKHYGLKEAIALAINAGNDMILFANQVSPGRVVKTDTVIKIVRELLKSGRVSETAIKRANARINALTQNLH